MSDFYIKTITPKHSHIIKSFGVFYLLSVGNLIGASILSDSSIYYIRRHKTLRYLLSFLLFYFLVIIVTDKGKLDFIPPIEKLFQSFFYYSIFFMIMSFDIRITTTLIALNFVSFFIELNKTFYLNIKTKSSEIEDNNIYNDHNYWITINWPFRFRLGKITDDDFILIDKIASVIFYLSVCLLVIGITELLFRNKNYLNKQMNYILR